MRLKKVNAVLAILSSLALIVHVSYLSYAMFINYYNEKLNILMSIPFMALTCAHAICGMCSVFLLGDGTRLDIYKKENKQTVIQRITAALIFPMLILHIQCMDILHGLSANGIWGGFFLLLFVQILYYAVVFSHVAVSFSKAFITLGLLSSNDTRRKIDRIVIIFCILMFIAASYVITVGKIKMMFY